MTTEDNNSRRKHDPFFCWLFAEPYHTKTLLELAGKVNRDVADFLATVNLDTLVRIPDSFSEVEDTGEGDLAFRVSVVTGAPVLVGILLEHKSGRDADVFNQIARYASGEVNKSIKTSKGGQLVAFLVCKKCGWFINSP